MGDGDARLGDSQGRPRLCRTIPLARSSSTTLNRIRQTEQAPERAAMTETEDSQPEQDRRGSEPMKTTWRVPISCLVQGWIRSGEGTKE
jgi:hypothetical protein